MRILEGVIDFSAPITAQLPLKIFYSGRLDNLNSLQEQFNLLGAAAETVILESFLKWGSQCAFYLRGDFAFVIWNPQTRSIYAARDIFGCKPFYYCYERQRFTFADSIPRLFEQLGERKGWNEREIVSLFTAGLASAQTYTDETYHQQVYRLTPGHYLYITPDRFKKMAYWSLDPQRADLTLKNEDDYLEVFKEKLHQAVKVRLGSTQTAFECSGGLDSSLVITTAKQQDAAIALFGHVGEAQGVAKNERLHMELLAKTLQIDQCHWVDARDFELFSTLQKCAEYFAGPMPYLFFYLAHNIHQAVLGQSYQVLLSGFGGDECVTGHAFPFIGAYLKQQGYRRTWQELIAYHTFHGKPLPPSWRRALDFFKAHVQRYTGEWPQWRSHYYVPRSAFYLKPEFLQKYQVPKKIRHPLVNPFYPTIPAHEYDYLLGKYSYHLRMRVEYSAIIAQAMGFEYRYPLLDRELVEFCFSLPLRLKRQQGKGRYLARRYLSHFLPEAIYGNASKRSPLAPATLLKFKQSIAAGEWDAHLASLPFVDLRKEQHQDRGWQFSLVCAFLISLGVKIPVTNNLDLTPNSGCII